MPDPGPVIETERFCLRPPQQSDLGLLQMYTGDRRVAEATRSIPHPLPEGATQAFIDRARAPDRVEDVWLLDATRIGGGEVLGCIGLKRMDRNQSEIAYWIAPAMWNTGLATAAVRALLEANPQGCANIFAEVLQDNPASARVLSNCGFAYLGDAETFSVARGASVATWTYSRKLD
ncbi:GNAT family N-acetyltransferase [Brevirhabdus pacifica]|uniref:GNAT family N-acetyltransferase n=1 Tax=Brevirhabdus pacifica TaxID=1267768 RepID=A0A1U7DLV3_9RHOB|nr:GNAT family N-acetyltransferase [Brevirhabdus pacifica]OWU80328.1 acetyltransferase [Loktanella sp. 22II-4b]